MFRISYNNVAETIIIRIMPTRLHECHSHWLHRVHRDWLRQNLVTLDQLDNLRVFYSPRQYSAIILYDFANSD